MNKRQRRRRDKQIRHDQFHPGIAKGLTLGLPADEALAAFPHKKPTGVEIVRHMARADESLERRSGRLPYAPFVAADSTDAVFSDGVTDRPQMSYDATYTPQGMTLLREGRQCLRCQEPHEVPFPVACDLCGYAMRDRQIMDIAMEFEGNKHLGPAKPISEWMNEQELRAEKRRWISQQIEKGSVERIPKEWLRDAHLFPDGPPEELL